MSDTPEDHGAQRRRIEEERTRSHEMMRYIILVNAEFALEELPADHPLQETLEEIRKATRRSADLTRQLLTFARKQTVEPRVLERQGYRVLQAATPILALALAARRHEPIDLLLTDVIMPGMNGRELADRLRETRPGLRCLYMSGYTADIIAHRGVLDEGVSFLPKPFTWRELADKVRRVLDA